MQSSYQPPDERVRTMAQINETVIQVVDPFAVDLLQKLWEYPASISGYCSSRCLIL